MLHNRVIRSEFTFELLRYCLGGDRPSQTSNHTLYFKIIILKVSQKTKKRVVFHFNLFSNKKLKNSKLSTYATQFLFYGNIEI